MQEPASPTPHDDDETPLLFADGRVHRSAIREGRVSRAALAQMQSERAYAINDAYRAFSSLVLIDDAIAEARDADERHGRDLISPIDGLALSVKGSIPVAGQLWTEGARLFAGRKAEASAPIVQKLRDAGALFNGTTTLSELAFYSPDNSFEPLAINPWSPSRTSGGSTAGGGAAAALGAAVLNLGTDAGGSIRNPACHCGAVGFKPTLARWPVEGVPNYAPTVGAMGIITRSVADVIAVDHVLVGGPAAPTSQTVTLLVPERLVESYSDEATRILLAAALDRLKAEGFAVEPFDEESWEPGERAAGIVSMAEGAKATASLDHSLLAPGLAARFSRAANMPADQVSAARERMAAFRAALMRNVPAGAVIVTPTWPFRAPHIYQISAVVNGRRVPMDPHRNIFVRAANAADAPAITLPAGLYPGRVPFGLHLMSAHGRDTDLLAAATRIEPLVAARMPRWPDHTG